MALDGLDQLTPAELQELAELLEAKECLEAQRSILALGQRITGFKPARHHAIIAAILDRWIDLSSGLDRLAIFMPPRHGKTLYGSHLAPVAVLGRHPKAMLMHISHTQRLASRFGRAIRNTIRDHRRNPYPGLVLADDSTAKDEWETTEGGIYNAFGLNGSPTGTPAEWLIVDDPVKGAEMASSAVQRDAAHETFISDVWTRLQGPQKQLWMLTRWHEDDPIGRILPADFAGRTGWYQDRDSGQWWFVLSLPAVSEHDNDPLRRRPGEYLWPEEHGDGSQLAAQRARAESGTGGAWAKQVWAALYQQRPAPLEGLYFDANDLRYYPHTKTLDKGWLDTLTIFGASDYALTDAATATDPDWTVHGVFGMDRGLNVYLLDLWRERRTPDVWATAFVNTCAKWRPQLWAEEDGTIIKSVEPLIREQIRRALKNGRSIPTRRIKFPVTRAQGNKEARAASIAGLIAMGRLFLPSGAPWLPALEAEVKAFPGGRHDDQVDMLGLAGRLIDRIIEKRPPEKERHPSPHGKDGMRLGFPWERDEALEDDAW